MIVLDASVVATVVGDSGDAGARARALLGDAGGAAVPDLADIETLSVLRRHVLSGALTRRRFRQAVDDLVALPLTRYPALPLIRRASGLVDNVTAYDAMYVTLAWALEAVLITGDARLAGAPKLPCAVELFRSG